MKTLYIERSTGECRSGDWVEKLDLEGIERIVVGTGPGSFAGIRSAIAFAQGYALGRPGLEVLGLPSPCAVAATVFQSSQRSNPQTLKPSNLQTLKPSNLQTFKPSNPQTFKPSNLQTLSPSLAVVGDARQGKIWIALFRGYRLEKAVFQVEKEQLEGTVPADCAVASPDDRRIGAFLKETFGERYLGEVMPSPEGLEVFAERCPEILVSEPLPIYLNPAVRTI